MINLNNFVIIGVSHSELSLEEREQFIKTKPINNIENLFSKGLVKGYVNLSTCLRVEFYLELKDDFDPSTLKNLFENDKVYLKIGIDAIRYLFELSCGFFSIIKGEDQILSQIKSSYLSSLDGKSSSKLLNIIFNKTIEIGKKFRAESLICHNALSLEAISLKLIKNHFTSLKNKKIFILGVGELSQSIINLFIKENILNIYVTNRTYHNAQVLKNKFDCLNLVDYRKKYNGLVEADIIISATSASHLVVDYERFKEIMFPEKNYFFLDLAVPRDIDIRLKDLKNIDIFNLDDVWDIYHKNSLNRDKLLVDYYHLIDEQLKKTLKSLNFYTKEDD